MGVNNNLCYCHLYVFPHRHGGGRCAGPGEFICASCGNATTAKRIDVGNEGEGVYMVDASDCCGAELWPNQPHERDRGQIPDKVDYYPQNTERGD